MKTSKSDHKCLSYYENNSLVSMCVRLTSSWTVTSMDSLERLSEKWSSMTRRWYNTLLRLDVRLWTSAGDRPASSSPSESPSPQRSSPTCGRQKSYIFKPSFASNWKL